MACSWLRLARQKDFVVFSQQQSVSLRTRNTTLLLILALTSCVYVPNDLTSINHAFAQASLALLAITLLLTIVVFVYRLMQWGWIRKHDSFLQFFECHYQWIIPSFATGQILCHVYHVFLFPSQCRHSWDMSDHCAQQLTGFITAIAGLVSTQLVLSVMMRDVHIELLFVLWLISVASITAALALFGKYEALMAAGVYLISSFSIQFESYNYHIKMFRLTQQLQDAKAENEQLMKKEHAEEMRSLMGNVAHDLKTPLTSFLRGIEFIASVLDDIETKISNGEFTSGLSEAVNSMRECLHGIYNTNSFMTMAINRCIDFTKTSRGLALLPKYETMDLLEALSLPLHCMQDIQSNISIVLNPLPADVCSHIITDKQWLQENLLCLLSNAVKYSDSGEVTVTVTLVANENAEVNVRTHSTRSSAVTANTHRFSRVLPEPQHPAHEQSISNNYSTIRYGEAASSSMALFHASAKASCYLLKVEVEDCGIGLTEQVMENLFTPFKQAQRLAGGTGLGLYSLAKRLDALKGTYGVRRRRDGRQGSLFWFAFPYRADAEFAKQCDGGDKLRLTVPYRLCRPRLSEHGASKETEVHEAESVMVSDSLSVLPANATHLAPLRSSYDGELQVLIVDDSASIVKMTAMMLKRLGHTVSAAENGAVALKKILKRFEKSDRPYDVIIMDLQMPVMDGLEATRRLRAWESETLPTGTERSGLGQQDENATPPRDATGGKRTHHIVIGVSANFDEDTMTEALAAGVDVFMSKPFSIDTFYSTLHAVQRELLAAPRT